MTPPRHGSVATRPYIATGNEESALKLFMERLHEYIRGNRSLAPLGLVAVLVLFYALSPHLPQSVQQYLHAILR